jgi:hypothetical protein
MCDSPCSTSTFVSHRRGQNFSTNIIAPIVIPTTYDNHLCKKATNHHLAAVNTNTQRFTFKEKKITTTTEATITTTSTSATTIPATNTPSTGAIETIPPEVPNNIRQWLRSSFFPAAGGGAVGDVADGVVAGNSVDTSSGKDGNGNDRNALPLGLEEVAATVKQMLTNQFSETAKLFSSLQQVDQLIINQQKREEEEIVTEKDTITNPVEGEFTGKIVMVDRGDCLFEEKAAIAQKEGALALIIRNREVSNILPPPPYFV